MTTECVGDLELHRGEGIPLASGSVDAVLASLLLVIYLDQSELLREVHRVLKPEVA
jgi:ubiquinone/menaquinone biosynthesis C-methylase UbiE